MVCLVTMRDSDWTKVISELYPHQRRNIANFPVESIHRVDSISRALDELEKISDRVDPGMFGFDELFNF